MYGLDIKNLSIESLVALRNDSTKLLSEKVATRERELQAEIARITGLNGGTAPKAKAAVKYQSET